MQAEHRRLVGRVILQKGKQHGDTVVSSILIKGAVRRVQPQALEQFRFNGCRAHGSPFVLHYLRFVNITVELYEAILAGLPLGPGERERHIQIELARRAASPRFQCYSACNRAR